MSSTQIQRRSPIQWLSVLYIRISFHKKGQRLRYLNTQTNSSLSNTISSPTSTTLTHSQTKFHRIHTFYVHSPSDESATEATKTQTKPCPHRLDRTPAPPSSLRSTFLVNTAFYEPFAKIKEPWWLLTKTLINLRVTGLEPARSPTGT